MSSSRFNLHINSYMKTGFILGILQFLVFFSGYDHIIKVGPFRTHHFIELPAFYYLGRGFTQFFQDNGLNNRNTILATLLVYIFNILVNPRGFAWSTILAALIVSFPYFIGAIQQIDKET